MPNQRHLARHIPGDSQRSGAARLSREERERLARVQVRQLDVLRRLFPGLRVR
jgi:hypothetical protein